MRHEVSLLVFFNVIERGAYTILRSRAPPNCCCSAIIKRESFRLEQYVSRGTTSVCVGDYCSQSGAAQCAPETDKNIRSCIQFKVASDLFWTASIERHTDLVGLTGLKLMIID